MSVDYRAIPFFVYGGVSIQPEISVTEGGGGPLGGDSVGADSFDKIYRVYSGDAQAYGHSWSRTDPGSVPNFRDEAGLPDANTGRFVIEGRLVNTDGVIYRPALPCDGNAGGGDEILVPRPHTQIIIDRVSGANPAI